MKRKLTLLASAVIPLLLVLAVLLLLAPAAIARDGRSAARSNRAVPAAPAASTPVFINELHYDNAGTDVGEGVEIAGPAGTDLSGWSIALYNGSGGVSYNTNTLSGTIPDQQNGYGTIFFAYPSNGIQNGPPDGLALVDPISNVVQFLSYEGAFTATDGPANGMLSTDIVVSETSTTPIGYSLQLQGSGSVYEDFTWADPLTATYDAVNTGQTFVAPIFEADLVVLKTGAVTALAGETITYTIDLSNVGNLTSTGTLVTDTLPAEVTFVTYTTAMPNAFSQVGSDLVWDLGDVANGASGTIDVQATISSTLGNGSAFTNTVTASTMATETVLANNTAQLMTVIGAPDLLVVKTGPASVNAGEWLTYTLTYTNDGDLAATNVTLVDQLPAAMQFITESTGLGQFDGVSTVTWTLGNLGVGASGSIDLVALANYTGDWPNTATISGQPADSDEANNSSTFTTMVNGADVYVQKDGPSVMFGGEVAAYTIVYGNRGNQDAAVMLTDTLPISFTTADIAADDSGLSFVDATGTRAWTAVITANTELSFTLAVTVPSIIDTATRVTNTLEIVTPVAGDDPADNSAMAAGNVYQVVPIATARALPLNALAAIEGTVTVEPGVFTYQGQNRYMYIQDATGGILVYRGGGLNPVARDHVVRLIGTLSEYKSETEFIPANADDVIDLGLGVGVSPLVTDTGSIDESLEGQLVQIAGQITDKPATYRLQVDDGSGPVEGYRYYNLGQTGDPNYIDFTPFNVGDYVQVTGVTRGYTETYGFMREVLPRGPADVLKFPQVLSVGPVNGSVGVAANVNVTATFNLTMTNVTSATFTLSGPDGAVAGTVTYDPATQTATFDPTSDLADGTIYTAILKAALMADNGLTLMPAQDTVWTFTTYQPTPSLSIAKNVATPRSEMELGDVVTYTFTLSNAGDGVATGVLITDVLPGEVTFGGFVQQNGAAISNDTITWSGTLSASLQAQIVFTATVGSDPAFYGRTVTNSVAFTSDNGGGDSAEAAFQIVKRYFLFLPLIARSS